MTDEQFDEVLRAYLEERVKEFGGDERGSHIKFATKTGIKRSQISRGLAGGGVSIGMLLRIADTVGPRMSALLADLAKRCANAEIDARLHETIETEHGGRAAVRAEDAQLVRSMARQVGASSKRDGRAGERQVPPRGKAKDRSSRRS